MAEYVFDESMKVVGARISAFSPNFVLSFTFVIMP
jgi:hypothetical protein